MNIAPLPSRFNAQRRWQRAKKSQVVSHFHP
jgi:hypothetical protein